LRQPGPPRRPAASGRISGNESSEPVPLSESLEALSARIGAGSAGTLAVVFGQWEAIVGPAVAAHVRPLRLESAALFVGVDHPAWVTQVKHLTPQILERLREACGEAEAPERLEVRVER